MGLKSELYVFVREVTLNYEGLLDYVVDDASGVPRWYMV
jgi:hypothetical protein